MRYVLYVEGKYHTESISLHYIQQIQKMLNKEGMQGLIRVLSPNQES